MRSAKPPTLVVLSLLAMVGATTIASCTSAPGRETHAGTEIGPRAAGEIDPEDAAALDALLDQIAGRRVIFVGEIHDRYDHHLNQLAVIRGLEERGVKLAIGMEYFQEPFQRHLDDYLAGRLDDGEMLHRTEYFNRWRFDYRLYREILEYARKHSIPLLALNAPGEMVEAVSRDGIAGLSPAYRSRLPAQIEPADPDYAGRLRSAFRMHGNLPESRFQRFMEVQSVWDEYMARRAAEYLERHPDRTLVVLVGSAHVLHDAAVPKRLRRYRPEGQAVIVTKPFESLPGVEPDFVFAARELALDPPGSLGMSLRGGKDGVVQVHGIAPGGAAEKAGLRVGDRVLRIGGNRIADLGDVRIAMLDGVPGDRVRVDAERGGDPSPRRMTKVLTLM